LDTDEKKTQIFGVFDGHGGADVAQFAAQYLPQRLKELQEFKDGKIEEALIKGFLEFDKSLTEDVVIEQLKILAGIDEASEDEDEDPALLRAEAEMDVQDVVAKYEKENPNSIPMHLKKSLAALSPMIRKKKDLDAGPSSSSVYRENPSDDASACASNTEEKEDVKSESKTEEPQVKTINGDHTKETVNGNGTITENGTIVEKGAGEVNEVIKKDEVISPDEDTPKKVDKGKRIVPKAVPMPKKEEDPDTEYRNFVEDLDSSEEDDEVDFRPKGEDSEELDSEDEEDDDDSGEDDDSEDDDEEDETSDEEEIDGMFGVGKDFEEPGKDSGCTAVVAVLRDNALYVANAGDSRCVVSKNGIAEDMSIDHKPEDDIEMERIKKAGGQVTPDGRVNGGLNLSRALGDHTYKANSDLPLEEQMISPLPDVKKIDIDSSTDFMVLACDGIW
jgi:protein phosphatase 1G